MVDARDSARNFLSKNRWRTKIEAATKKPESRANQDDDVNDFLRPSVDRAQSHKQAAAAAFLAGAKPRIDVASAQRWPGASEIASRVGASSPAIGIGAMRSGTRKRGLTVSFSRTQPDIIGEGGDECEEPSIEVSRRLRSQSVPNEDTAQPQTHQDDMHLGTRSVSANKEAERRGIVTRTLTSHGELSPPLQRKMELGNINTHAAPPPPPPRGLGPMGLGERPRALQRAPTGFDMQDSAPSRPSLDSDFSYESENLSPVVSRTAPSLATTVEEEEDFRPPPLQRTATGWSEHLGESDEDAPPPLPRAPRLPEVDLKDDNSPLDSTLNKFLESESADRNAHSARSIHAMRAEEGRALHEGAAQHVMDKSLKDAGPSNFQVGTPPGQFTVPLAGKTPPRLLTNDPPPESPSPKKVPEAGFEPYKYEPYKPSAVQGAPSQRRHIPPETHPIDTNPRLPSSPQSSQYSAPSAASRTRPSPTDYFSAPPKSSIQRSPALIERTVNPAATSPYVSSSQPVDPVSSTSQTSIVPTPPQFEKPGYIGSPESSAQARAPASHSVDPRVAHPRRDTAHETSPNTKSDPEDANTLARSDTKSQAEAAFVDFAHRVQHMKSIFMLTAQLAGKIYDHTPMQWLRVATWWFLKGRAGMETLIRNRPRDGPQQERLTQAHVDLAKAWWILTEVIENHPGLRRYEAEKKDLRASLAPETGDLVSAEAYELHDGMLHSLKMLLGSMKRHQSMPPTQALIQGQDQSIWLEYPTFAPDAHSVLAGTASRSMSAKGVLQSSFNPATLIPLGDNKNDFCYFRMFVNVSLATDDPRTDRVPLPAVISVLRPRDSYKVELSICSQTELVNVVVGSNPDAGPTWKDVAWKSKTRGMSIQLRHNFNLNVELAEQDFRALWAIVDHTNRVEGNLRERSDERLSLRINLREFSYVDPTNPGAFPAGRAPGCKLMVFRKFERSSEGTGRRKLHRGHRLAVVTNTKDRTLSCVNHELGSNQEPLNFEYTSDPATKAPGLTLRFKEGIPDKKQKLCTMSLIFNDPGERNLLFGTFTSMNQEKNEAVFAKVPLKAFSIESADPAEGFSQSGKDVLKRLQWMEAKALNQDPEAVGLESAPTVMSESLRIVCRHKAGVISDRMNLGPGELLVRLPIDGAAELTLLRNPQHDMAIAIDGSHTDKDVPDALAELLRTLTNASTIRRLTFNSYKDLHDFQLAVTGFQVIFDGIASSFSVSRRRMVVPIYKQWTATTIRIQVVAQDNIIQLLAFFEGFSHADAMNFQLKSMDTFEKTDKGGKPCVRLVDAKFALPVEERKGEGKMGKEEGKISGWAGMKRRFVCLDQIEYPGEHDDILIAFDDAETRDRFAAALPAAAQVGRKFTVRRKI